MRTVSLTADELFALSNEQRRKIINVSQKEHSLLEIKKLIKDRSKKETTLRHHISILVKAGLLEVTRLEEVRGAHLKYYKAKIRISK